MRYLLYRLYRALSLTLCLLAFAHTAVDAQCTALVQMAHELWVVDREGKPLQRLTSDGKKKFEVAWSPDSALIAYKPESKPRTIVLINSAGRFLSEVEVRHPGVTSLFGLSWEAPNILRYEGHGGPHGSYFGFWELPSDGDLRKATVLPEGGGLDCALSPDHRHVACLEEDGISIDDALVYAAADQSISLREEDEAVKKRVAWDATGRRVATIVTSNSGLTFVLLQASGTSPQGTVRWAVVTKPFPEIPEPIDSIKLSADGRTAILETAEKTYDLNLVVGTMSTRPAARRLPKQLTVQANEQPVQTEVLGWHCGQ